MQEHHIKWVLENIPEVTYKQLLENSKLLTGLGLHDLIDQQIRTADALPMIVGILTTTKLWC